MVRIRLESREPGGQGRRVVVLEDQGDIDRLLALASFPPKEPCDCAHLEKVIFETASDGVRASICDHCFDALGENYAMSPGFYSAFQDLLTRRGTPATK